MVSWRILAKADLGAVRWGPQPMRNDDLKALVLPIGHQISFSSLNNFQELGKHRKYPAIPRTRHKLIVLRLLDFQYMALFLSHTWLLDVGLGVLLCMCDSVPLHLVLLLNVATLLRYVMLRYVMPHYVTFPLCHATFCGSIIHFTEILHKLAVL